MFFRVCLCLCAFFSINLFAKERLIVGTSSGYAPFVSLNESGDYEGFDIDIAHCLAEKLDCELVIKDLGSMPSLFMGLKQNKIDLVIWGVSITEERKNQITMIHYQGKPLETLPLLFWSQIPEGIETIEDLIKDPKAKICVESGSYQAHFVQKFPEEKIKQVDKVTDAIMEIKYGKSSATMVDPSLMPKLMDQFKELKVIQVPLEKGECALGNGICVSKKRDALAKEVRNAIEAMKDDGTIGILEKKWNMVE